MSAHWSDDYIGIPYSTADCGELAARVQRDVFGRDVTLPIDRPCNLSGRSRMIDQLLLDYGRPTDSPRDGDAVLLSAGSLWHIGVYCLMTVGIGSDQPWLLHTTRHSVYSTRIPLRRAADTNMIISGYYQWR